MYILPTGRRLCVSGLNAKYYGLVHYLIQLENKLLPGMRAPAIRTEKKEPNEYQ